MKILLNEKKHKRSINVDNKINVELSTDARVMPSGDAQGTLDQYNQYLKEKDESQKYRLIFTINPICSNVLFNAITEVVYQEGSNDCKFFGKTGTSMTPSALKYYNYKTKKKEETANLTREEAIRDTAYSHPDIGPYVYHCGYDIFNNHTLRKKEFNVVTPITEKSKNPEGFNTIRDIMRTYDGEGVTRLTEKVTVGGDGKTPANNILSTGNWYSARLYNTGNIMSFAESIEENLVEDKGWMGFINPTTLGIVNYKYKDGNTLHEVVINKCMNNNRACEQIDMYPDRSLYSFVPKINKYRDNRTEANWDYCLTYPYRSTTLTAVTDVVEHQKYHINGLKAHTVDVELGKLDGDSGIENVLFKTDLRNNLTSKSLIELTIIGEGTAYTNNTPINVVTINTPVNVVSVGHNGDDTEHYFTLSYEEIGQYVECFSNIEEYRVRRMHNNIPCKYYFRMFKRIPNFTNTNVYSNGKISTGEIEKYAKRDFCSSLNKLAFGKSIYSDDTVQIVFTDDVNLKGLQDNLGRQVSEVYLTIVKRNQGHNEWYNNKDYGSPNVEFSHCFSKVTSGLDMPYDYYTESVERRYNIHTIHNIGDGTSEFKNTAFTIPAGERPLEGDIVITGNTYGEFLGDIVEFIPSRLEENTIEKIYHRFNTAQREYYTDNTNNNEYASIVYDDIKYDTDDVYNDASNVNKENFAVTSLTYNLSITRNQIYDGNLFPEGYYYQPHYKVALREYSDTIHKGSHIRIVTREIGFIDDNTYSALTSKNYYFEMGDEMYLYNDTTNEKVNGWVTKIEGKNFNQITFGLSSKIDNFTQYKIYRRNPECPSNAYELDDGSGIYVWRDVKSSSEIDTDSELYDSTFTNGAHYFQKNINFYLKRQDPLGVYGLSYANRGDVVQRVQKLDIPGEYTDVSGVEIVEEDTTCSSM